MCQIKLIHCTYKQKQLYQTDPHFNDNIQLPSVSLTDH
jgi:hypothetical protein